jgi:hypothetical protein
MKYLDDDEWEDVLWLERHLVIDGNPVTVRITDEEIESLIDRIQQYLNTEEGEGSTYTGIAEGTGILRETVETIMKRIRHV